MSLSFGYRNRPRKQKSRDPRNPSERSIQYALVDRLRLTAAPDSIWFAIPNGELGDLSVLAGEERRSAYKLRAMGVLSGVFDFFFAKAGDAFFMELKREDGRLSTAQSDFMHWCSLAGIPCFVCYGLNEAIDLLTAKGILPPDRRVK